MIAFEKRTVLRLPLKTTAPSKYEISLHRGPVLRQGEIIINETFSNELSKVFNLSSESMYALLKNSITYGKTVSFGEYTKDVAETMVINAESVCKKYNPAILPIFVTVKI
jgi:hypothetical protein